MVTFQTAALVSDDVTEHFGEFYIPHRGRQTCRGADGRFYTAYAGLNGAGTSGIVRVSAWSANALGTITEHWNFKVGDAGVGHGLSDVEPPASFAIAIDNNGSAERVLVAVADSTGDLMRFFYTSTASPAAFTAGDTFSLKEPEFTVSIGMDLFGRNGSGVITLVYGNAQDSDIGTSVVVVKSRTLSAHGASWSSAVDVIPSILPYQNEVFFSATRLAGGNITVLASHGSGALLTGLIMSSSTTPYTSWSATKQNATVDFANYAVLSIAADTSNAIHALFLEELSGTQRLRYMKYTSNAAPSENVILHALTFVNSVSLPSTFSYRFYRSGSLTVDQDGVPHIVAALRSNPSGWGTTPSGGYLEGQSIYYRKVGTSFAQYIATNRKSQTIPDTGLALTVNSQSMPHDVCVIGKLGYPAAGAMWTEVACHNQTLGGGGAPSCVSPGIRRRIVMTDDWEPGLTRRGRNALSGGQTHVLAGPKPVSAINVVVFAQSATHPGSTFPRTGANAMTINGSVSAGKGKTGANAFSLAQLASAFVDFLSKWKVANLLDFTQSATQTRVITRGAQNFIVLADGFGKAFPCANALEFAQLAVASGSLRVFAANSINFDQGSVHDPLEGCETNYATALPIPSDPDSLVFVSITAPAQAPQKTITLRRPELDDDTARFLQGEIARAQDGAAQTAIRGPNPIEFGVTFTGLTRRQVIELEDFFVAWRGKTMIYRDHNNWRWTVWLLTTKPVFQSEAAESWRVSLQFSGTLIVEA